jgi:hypothetical protein
MVVKVIQYRNQGETATHDDEEKFQGPFCDVIHDSTANEKGEDPQDNQEAPDQEVRLDIFPGGVFIRGGCNGFGIRFLLGHESLFDYFRTKRLAKLKPISSRLLLLPLREKDGMRGKIPLVKHPSPFPLPQGERVCCYCHAKSIVPNYFINGSFHRETTKKSKDKRQCFQSFPHTHASVKF